MGKRNEAKQWEDDVAGMFSTVVQGDLYCRECMSVKDWDALREDVEHLALWDREPIVACSRCGKSF